MFCFSNNDMTSGILSFEYRSNTIKWVLDLQDQQISTACQIPSKSIENFYDITGAEVFAFSKSCDLNGSRD